MDDHEIADADGQVETTTNEEERRAHHAAALMLVRSTPTRSFGSPPIPSATSTAT